MHCLVGFLQKKLARAECGVFPPPAQDRPKTKFSINLKTRSKKPDFSETDFLVAVMLSLG